MQKTIFQPRTAVENGRVKHGDIFDSLKEKYGSATAVARAINTPLRTYFDWQKRERNNAWSRTCQRDLVMRRLRDAILSPL